jgi:hypothetical protein
MENKQTIETLVGSHVIYTPTGTPTERLIWNALRALQRQPYLCSCGTVAQTYTGAGALSIFATIGGSHRAFDDALKSLIRRGVVGRTCDSPNAGYKLLDGYVVDSRLNWTPDQQEQQDQMRKLIIQGLM